MEINQIITAMQDNDAVSNSMITFRNLFRKLGYKSDIYARYNSCKNEEVLNYKKFKSNKNNILIYHYCFDNLMFYFVRALSDKKILYYHGIAPLKHFIEFGDN